MEYLENWYEHHSEFMQEFGSSLELFSSELNKRVVATIKDTPVVVWDDAVYAILQVSDEFELGAAYHATFKVIIMNNKTWNMDPAKRDAIIWHELGHKFLRHDTIEQQWQELEADKFSVENGYDMHAALVYCRAELIRMFNLVDVPQENRDAALAAVDERIAAVA